MKLNKQVFVVVFILFVSFRGFSQSSSAKFDHLSSSDGLSQNSIYSITQDSLGYIWFATYDGLNRYDGYTMQVFRNDPDDSNSLSDNAVNQIIEVSGSKLWIATKTAGMCLYDYKTETFKSFPFPEGNNALAINSVEIEASNKFWLGTERGLWLFENGKYAWISGLKKEFIYDLELSASKKGLWLATEKGLKYFDFYTLYLKDICDENYIENQMEMPIKCLYKAINGTIWVGKENGLYKINTDNTFSKVHCSYKLANLKINAITEDNVGNIWLATKTHGLVRLETNTNKITVYDNDPSNPHSLTSNQIRSVFIDKSNTLWVGNAWAGVDKWSRTTENVLLFKKKPNNPNSLNSNQIRSVYKDHDNVIWIGTVDGGLNKYDPLTRKFTHYTHNPKNPNSISNNTVRCLKEDKNGNFWVGTDGGGLNLMNKKTGNFKCFKHIEGDKKSLPNDRVWTLFEDKRGQLIIGTFGGGIAVLDSITRKFTVYKNILNNENCLSNNFVTSLYQDTNGDIWIGTFGGGLNRWSPTTLHFTHYKQVPGDTTSISNNRIYAINQDSDGKLWIGTKDGLNLYNPQKQTFKRYNEDNGLPNNVVMGILATENKELWISTNKGLAKINTIDFSIKNYDADDGLQANEFLVGAFHKSYDGMFFFGGVGGLNAFYPTQMKFNDLPPNIVVNEFKIFDHVVNFKKDDIIDQPIEFVRNIKLKYSQNSFSFDFSGLHFTQPLKNKYVYRLKDFNDNWIAVGAKRRFVSYTNIDPGEYVFQIKASNSDGIWQNEPREIRIEITPPIWATWWFRISATILVLGLGFFWYRMRIRSIELQNKKLEQIVFERTEEVVNQKNEIEIQALELSEKNEELNIQKNEIQKKNEQITSSIRYAKTIQSAILPIHEKTKQYIQSFLLFRPKDIVSGDFYWFAKIEKENQKYLFFAVVDCTGHGVPGAFMSMIGSRLLNEIVLEKLNTETNAVLELLDQGVKKSLKQEQSENNDGMDLCLMRVNYPYTDVVDIQYTGAKRPLIFSDSEKNIQLIKGDRRSIGGVKKRTEPQPFTANELQMKNNSLVILSTDGFIDQNNPERRRYGTENLLNLLQNNVNSTLEELNIILENELDKHQSNAMQRDDITLWGLKF